MRNFNSNEIIEVTGLTARTLQIMCEEGIVTPISEVGRGQPRHFSVMQAIGLVVVAGLRAQERGCSLEYAKTVIDAFINTTEDELLAMFKKGKKYFMRVNRGKPVLWDVEHDWIDVKAAYEAVSKYVQ